MTADDQRAAETAVDNRVLLDALAYRQMACYLGQKQDALPSQLFAEVDRLRAELAETRAAGDAVLRAMWGFARRLARTNPDLRVGELVDVADAWRSVRGDALTEPTAAPCQGTCTGCGAGEDQVCTGDCSCVTSGVHDRDGYTPDMPEYTAPAVGLPVTLSSVDDVVEVFRSVPGMSERTGPGSKRVYQDPQGVYLGVVLGPGPVGLMVDVHGCDGERYSFQGPRLSRDALSAAIEAARGGSR